MSNPKKLEDPELQRLLVGDQWKLLEQIIDRGIEQRRSALVAGLMRRFAAVVNLSAAPAAVDRGEDWTAIESLSRLRSTVGGRFQNLKERWVEAGLPLRQHRGDRGKRYVIDDKGWVELSNWIARQGFESRLTPDKPDCFFEVRPSAKPG